MENFQFCISTKVLFGKGQIENLPQVASEYGQSVLLVYGGGSIKRIGVYDSIKSLLAGCEVVELSGIAPNPRIESVREGVKLCREHGVDWILAVGGGSVIDCAKVIAAAACTDMDAWQMIVNHAAITEALPICAIPTLAATGSETDAGAVISNTAINEKRSFFSPLIMPKVAIMDPTYTFTVPASQTAAGSADILSHLLEQYFVPQSTFMGDLLVEGVMKTIIHYTPIALAEPDNYEARAQLLWGSAIADNATLCNGNRICPFGVHGMEHELSAYYDITHGVGLAILTPRWMRHVLSDATVERFAHFAQAVWGVAPSDDKYAMAHQGIDATERFFKSIGIPMTLTELGINNEHFAEMARHAVETEGLLYAYVPLTEEDVVAIFNDCI
ncbi:MAG: iron-containing alcohol dehydrogenase [Bacteroides sp.]|nr:iron-containing alcohol dehydrogenase [Bacteroides sp.]